MTTDTRAALDELVALENLRDHIEHLMREGVHHVSVQALETEYARRKHLALGAARTALAAAPVAPASAPTETQQQHREIERFREYREVTKPLIDAKVRIHSCRVSNTFIFCDGRISAQAIEFSAEEQKLLAQLDELIQHAYDRIFNRP